MRHEPLRRWAVPWLSTPWQPACIEGEQRMRLLNRTVRVAAPTDWNDPALPLLLRYHLHYFDDLDAEGASARRVLQRRWMVRWIDEHPPGAFPGWDPYPTALRLVNWIKWCWQDGGGREPEAAILDSIATQAAWLRRNLEFDLLGNHLLADAKGLCFAGLFFTGPDGRRWLERGRSLLLEQLPRQILADGGHDERSPAYHALVLHDLLELVRAWRHVGLTPPEPLCAPVPAMLRWLQVMTHPDGGIAFFNDATLGQAPGCAHLGRLAVMLALAEEAHATPPGTVDLPESGYMRLEQGGMVVLLDAAPAGSADQPGHAHADTLSFECSLDGRRLIVNSGIDRYGDDAERRWQRSTAAHSTLEVDGADSSEVWGGFRLAGRAEIVDRGMRREQGGVVAWGAHDGYRRLPGVGIHRREWRLWQGRLEVRDRLEGGGRHRLVSRFYLHPELDAVMDGEEVALRRSGRTLAVIQAGGAGGRLRLVSARYFPAFGRVEANRCVELSALCTLPAELSAVVVWR
ncbi:MAG: heparinase [Zetaproteobacteria bacterium]|nr:MAG: heparinase [Zetaproteobacteria bacterium]